MGRSTRSGCRARHHHRSSQTLPSSPTHSLASSSSSSDFEFTVSISPRKSSAALCPADELFYKGQLLPLQLSPRLSMVRNLLLSSPSSSGAATDSSRDSSGSSSDFSSCCDSSRPSSAADPYDEELKRLHNFSAGSNNPGHQIRGKTASSGKYFSLPKLSAVFRKDANAKSRELSSVKRMSASAKEVIRKYLKRVKPLYEKLSTKQQQQRTCKMTSVPSKPDDPIARSAVTLCAGDEPSPAEPSKSFFNHSFSGNLRYPRIGSSKRSTASCAASSCPSSMRSSPSHSGVLGRGGYPGPARTGSGGMAAYFHGDSAASTMAELQSAIQGAIAHCKNSMQQQQQGKRGQGQSGNFGPNVL